MSRIIITAPHSLCLANDVDRNCDTVAAMASSDLVLQLQTQQYDGRFKLIKVDYFPADTFRNVYDLNRTESRGTPYRQILSAAMNEAQLLIDVHSAPNGVYGVEADVIVLDDYPGTWYGQLLCDSLINFGIKAAYIYGSDINDINEEARYRGLPAILLEYGEFLGDSQIKGINKCVIQWIHHFLQ